MKEKMVKGNWRSRAKKFWRVWRWFYNIDYFSGTRFCCRSILHHWRWTLDDHRLWWAEWRPVDNRKSSPATVCTNEPSYCRKIILRERGKWVLNKCSSGNRINYSAHGMEFKSLQMHQFGLEGMCILVLQYQPNMEWKNCSTHFYPLT